MNTQCSDWADVWAKYRDHAKPVVPRDLDELPYALDASGGVVARPLVNQSNLSGPINSLSVSDQRKLFNERQAQGRAVLAAIGLTPIERIYR